MGAEHGQAGAAMELACFQAWRPAGHHYSSGHNGITLAANGAILEIQLRQTLLSPDDELL